ncbi:MAG: hypothetical protein H6R19_1185 [Proteobacteria bacterium]|nr:hypothetical protein [Pseudomonadota bacterium]
MGLLDSIKSGAERTWNFVTGGSNDRKKSERLTRYARDIESECKEKLETSREETNDKLCELGELRVRVYSTSIAEFVNLYDSIQDINDTGIGDIEEDVTNQLVHNNIRQLKETTEHVQQMMLGGGAGALGGATLALGAWGLAGTIGTASTGTAIGTLSGVAATNATLAWLGGGAASAGGLGVAGGTAVLGGIALLPVAVLAMYFGQTNAKTRLNEAREVLHQAEAYEEEVNTFVEKMHQIQKGANLLIDAINVMENIVIHQNRKMSQSIRAATDFADGVYALTERRLIDNYSPATA